MVAKRIIPCLDVKNGRTVKGIQFESLVDMGDPAEFAQYYSDAGADELVFLDISASLEQRKTLLDTVQKVAEVLSIPFTVGGGIATLHDVEALLHAGADKISINSSAVTNPLLITEIAKTFGSQCVVVAIDSRADTVWIKGGKQSTELETVRWAKEVVSRGAGEILLTSMQFDGTKQGFDIQLLDTISHEVSIPIIASGGAGTPEHFTAVFQQTQVSAALAAGILHSHQCTIEEIKNNLRKNNIEVRI